MAYTALPHKATGDLVTAADWNTLLDDLAIVKTQINDDGTSGASGASLTRGMAWRTHPDPDLSNDRVLLFAADEVVMDDATRYTNPLAGVPLVCDFALSGAGGIDTGTRTASTFYELFLVGKTSRLAADLKLCAHRAKGLLVDQTFTTATDVGRALRVATSTATDRLTQGFTPALTAALHVVSAYIGMSGTPTGYVWLEIWSDSGGNPGVKLSTSAKIDVSKIGPASPGSGSQWIAFPFFTPYALVAGTPYHLVLQGDYTRSDTINARWLGVIAGGYAGGVAKEFDGSSWSTAAGVGDFNFTMYVMANDVAFTIPSGYSHSCSLGYVFHDASSHLVPMGARDRRQRYRTPQAIGSFATDQPVLAGLINFVPPGPIQLAWQCDAGAEAQITQIANLPEGYQALTSTYDWTRAQWGDVNVPAAVTTGSASDGIHHGFTWLDYALAYIGFYTTGPSVVRVVGWDR